MVHHGIGFPDARPRPRPLVAGRRDIWTGLREGSDGLRPFSSKDTVYGTLPTPSQKEHYTNTHVFSVFMLRLLN